MWCIDCHRRLYEVSMPHAALWVVQRLGYHGKRYGIRKFQCRTRLCGWCNLVERISSLTASPVSMPHAALWVVQLLQARTGIRCRVVSMPHAALWVVQPYILEVMLYRALFQCRTRLCGWCNEQVLTFRSTSTCFNAARGFVGGATPKIRSSLASSLSFNAARGFVGGAT